jgi:purine nucleosidase
MKMKAIILDVDTGIDDALAISYAVRSPELEVLGITTCYGNVTVEEATRNTLVVLEHLERDIPVIQGAGIPFLRQPTKGSTPHIHGIDGIGNTLKSLPQRKALEDHAADFIIDQIKRQPLQVTLITVGTLTNLALAIQKSPDIVRLVERVVVMGGAVTVGGNVTASAEANVYADPDAAEYVFRSGIPVTLVGLDVTMKTLLPIEELQRWRDKNSKLGHFLADMTEFYMGAYERFYPGTGGCALHDPLAVGVVINPGFVKSYPMQVHVDLEGETLGRTVGVSDASAQVTVCTEVDAETFLAHFISRIC